MSAFVGFSRPARRGRGRTATGGSNASSESRPKLARNSSKTRHDLVGNSSDSRHFRSPLFAQPVDKPRFPSRKISRLSSFLVISRHFGGGGGAAEAAHGRATGNDEQPGCVLPIHDVQDRREQAPPVGEAGIAAGFWNIYRTIWVSCQEKSELNR